MKSTSDKKLLVTDMNYSISMEIRMNIFHLNKSFDLKFRDRLNKEWRILQRPKCCKYINQKKDGSPNGKADNDVNIWGNEEIINACARIHMLMSVSVKSIQSTELLSATIIEIKTVLSRYIQKRQITRM